MKPTMVVGTNLKRARKEVGLSQPAFGEAVEAFLGHPWSRQTVSEAEKGRRRFDATELMAFAAITGKPPEWFLTPREPWSEIEFPAGVVVPWESISRGPNNAEGPTPMELAGAFDVLFEIAARAERDASSAAHALEFVRTMSGYFHGLELTKRAAPDQDDYLKGMDLMVGALNQMGDFDLALGALERYTEVMGALNAPRAERAAADEREENAAEGEI